MANEEIIWNGENFEDIHAETQGACVLENDGTLGVHTAHGYQSVELGGRVLIDDVDGSVSVAGPPPTAAKKKAAARKKTSAAKAQREPTIRELIHQLRNRCGRVQAVSGIKVPQLVVMSQDLREHLLALDEHPSIDDDRA